MPRTKKTPEELLMARQEKARKHAELEHQQRVQREQAEAEFKQNLPTLALNLLKQAKELRELADPAGVPRFDDHDFNEDNCLDFDSLGVVYYIWGGREYVKFDKLLTVYTKRDYENFVSDFEQLRDSYQTKLEVKLAKEREEERVRQVRSEALGKLTDEEKKVLGVR